MANECTSVMGHFDGHGGAPVQYGAHRPMQNDQGFTAATGRLLTWYCRCGHHNAAIGLIFEVRGVGDGAMWVDKAIFT